MTILFFWVHNEPIETCYVVLLFKSSKIYKPPSIRKFYRMQILLICQCNISDDQNALDKRDCCCCHSSVGESEILYDALATSGSVHTINSSYRTYTKNLFIFLLRQLCVHTQISFFFFSFFFFFCPTISFLRIMFRLCCKNRQTTKNFQVFKINK